MPKSYRTIGYAVKAEFVTPLARVSMMAWGIGVLQACNGADATAPTSEPNPLTRAKTARIAEVLGDTLSVGGVIVVRGEGFSADQGGMRVLLGERELPVRILSASQAEADIPQVGFPCGVEAAVPVKVSVPGHSVTTVRPFRTSTRVELQPGEQRVMEKAEDLRCLELGAAGTTGAGYRLSVVRVNGERSKTAGFILRGTGSGALAGVQGGEPTTTNRMLAPSAGMPGPTRITVPPSDGGAHGALVASQIDLVTRAGAPRFRSAERTGATAGRIMTPRREGDVLSLNALLGSCANGSHVRARVVYAGVRALVLEDERSAWAGRMDSAYRRIGHEFDEVVYPLLAAQIGDPLALDNKLDASGRVTMLFTRFVNDSMPGVAGFVSACNFYPKETFAGSNERTMFYARVPAAWETPSDWSRVIRSTVVHEAKHLASFAQRLAQQHDFEEPWLEEATARVSEELYARSFSGNGWRGHASFAETVQCEIEQCDERPLVMWKHFSGLHKYLRGADTLSPISPASPSDDSYYASGWSLVRWVLDHHAKHESTVLRALVKGGNGTGIEALAAQVGVPVQTLLASWGASHSSSRSDVQAQQSWDVSTVWRGLSTMFPTVFSAAPVNVRPINAGNFEVHRDGLRVGSIDNLGIDIRPTGAQLVELVGGEFVLSVTRAR